MELWKQFEPTLKWRAERPGRVVVMDGKSTAQYLQKSNVVIKIPQAAPSAFDTDWLHQIVNISNSMTREIQTARTKGWKVDTTAGTAADGHAQSVVTIESKAGLPDNNYLKNKSMETADLRRVYRFDAQTKQLEAVQIYLEASSGDMLVFESSQIDYNQPIGSAVFHLDLPANVSEYKEPQKLPDNAKYAAMTPQQVARAFFEACGRQDWTEVEKYDSFLTDGSKQFLGGLEIISVGDPFKSKPYPGWFVPYEVKLPSQEINVRVSNINPAKRCVVTGIYDSKMELQQDLNGPGEAEILADNDNDAWLSSAAVVQAYFDAQAKFDWTEMRKFTSETDVQETKKQVETAKNAGMDVQQIMPVVEVGEATWSAEQSAWFVKCQMHQVKKWNLVLRKDNPAGRWQVDGGI